MKTTLLQRGRAALAGLFAWRWAKPAGRAAGAVIALVVLAVIGRATLAGAASPTTSDGAEPSTSARSSEEGAAAIARPAEAHAVPLPPAAALLAVEPSSLPLARTEAPEPSTEDMGGDRPATAAHHRPATADDPVYLNEATVADLQRLPNVGLKRANAILALRQRLGGRFQQIEQLMKVRGMGAKAMKRLRPLMRLDRSPTADAGAPHAGKRYASSADDLSRSSTRGPIAAWRSLYAARLATSTLETCATTSRSSRPFCASVAPVSTRSTMRSDRPDERRQLHRALHVDDLGLHAAAREVLGGAARVLRRDAGHARRCGLPAGRRRRPSGTCRRRDRAAGTGRSARSSSTSRPQTPESAAPYST